MNQALELTLEQDLSLRRFADIVQQMSLEQAQDFLVQQHKLMLTRDILYRQLLKQELQSDLDACLSPTSF